jgi:chemotaxis signal transduction protein
MPVANAWLIDFGDEYRAAIGERELFHLVYEPQLFQVPHCPAHCDRVIVWEGRVLPVWNLRKWLRPDADTPATRLVAVIGYRPDDRDDTEFGAVEIAAPPQRIVACDDDACALPADSPAWVRISTSCFAHNRKQVPALNLTSMFGRVLPTEA